MTRTYLFTALVALATAFLAACGVEAVGTAATTAELQAQEAARAQQQMEEARRRIEEANAELEERRRQIENEAAGVVQQ